LNASNELSDQHCNHSTTEKTREARYASNTDVARDHRATIQLR
jgi:hypothetical protein